MFLLGTFDTIYSYLSFVNMTRELEILVCSLCKHASRQDLLLYYHALVEG